MPIQFLENGERMKKSDYITISQQCIKNIKGLLTGVTLLLENETTGKYALGLYMYAVEEYGKMWLLKKYLENKNEGELSPPSGIFDDGSHNKKIDEGFKHLPDECKKLSFFREIKVNTSPNDKIIKLENGKTVLVLAGTTGIYENSPGPSKRYVQREFKTECFYIDSDPFQNKERENLYGEPTIMKSNVTLFIKSIEKYIDTFHKI